MTSWYNLSKHAPKNGEVKQGFACHLIFFIKSTSSSLRTFKSQGFMNVWITSFCWHLWYIYILFFSIHPSQGWSCWGIPASSKSTYPPFSGTTSKSTLNRNSEFFLPRICLGLAWFRLGILIFFYFFSATGENSGARKRTAKKTLKRLKYWQGRSDWSHWNDWHFSSPCFLSKRGAITIWRPFLKTSWREGQFFKHPMIHFSIGIHSENTHAGILRDFTDKLW